jgi:hypothetical protein
MCLIAGRLGVFFSSGLKVGVARGAVKVFRRRVRRRPVRASHQADTVHRSTEAGAPSGRLP